MNDLSNDKIAEIKISQPFLRLIDKKLDEDYYNFFSTTYRKIFIVYQITILVFWILDLIFQGTANTLDAEQITKIAKLIVFIIGWFLLIESFQDLFLNYFCIYFSIHIIIDIVAIYLEKSDNDIKLCLQMIVMFLYPILFCGRRFKIVFFVVLLFCVGTFPA